MPTGKLPPGPGLGLIKTGTPQLSVAVGAVQVAVAEQRSGMLLTVIGEAGQPVITGGTLSLMVMVWVTVCVQPGVCSAVVIGIEGIGDGMNACSGQ